MPDPRLADRFAAQVERREAGYARAALQLLQAARLRLVETLLRSGLSTEFSLAIRRELDELRRQVSRLAGEQAGPVEDLVLAFARRQFDLVARLLGQSLDFSQAAQSTAAERQAILAGLDGNARGWIDVLEVRLLAELSRLRSGEETVEAAAARLLAEDVADGRVSVWRHGRNALVQESGRDLWAAGAALAGSLYRAGQSQAGQQWNKQAIAAIDENTTDCCLRVHGQIQPLGQTFSLTGTPRYADRMQHPPFHGHCRTVEALYLEVFETVGVPTGAMRDAARAELEARASTGRRVEIHPANATSRR